VDEPFDAAVLRGQDRVKELAVLAPLVRGIRHLRGARLESLVLSQVRVDEALRETLLSMTATLTDLRLDGPPFSPEDLAVLPRLGKLSRLTVPA
jgi:hypothetical protein